MNSIIVCDTTAIESQDRTTSSAYNNKVMLYKNLLYALVKKNFDSNSNSTFINLIVR